MDLIRKAIDPESRYSSEIPNTYEARVAVLDNNNEYESYIADTICALVQHLAAHNISADNVEIFEIFKQDRKALNISFCITQDGKWLDRRGLCQSLKAHYPGHITTSHCSFAERGHIVTGP